MRTTLTLACVILSLCYGGMAVSQDLPDDILADQYLLEARKALESGEPQTARRAFEKIEALDTEPPLEFYFSSANCWSDMARQLTTSARDRLRSSNLSSISKRIPNITGRPWNCFPSREKQSKKPSNGKRKKQNAKQRRRNAPPRSRT